ncbi:MAG TPA: hypothetical protein VFW66_08585 [Gemmatimonadales bacterium]|nr:hypothetical protein [Gemmatimonadales bacterium]
MYSTCLFCYGSLGHNEVIEHFPIGRRLAFDAEKGRLWVICAHCARWNLTPLEERWEAIEECERLFRGQRLRAQTEQIGLTKLREGLELVRIGRPLRPEFAAWRYGNEFRRRLRRRVTWVGTGVAAAGVAAVGVVAGAGEAALTSVALPALWLGGAWIVNSAQFYRDYLRPTYVPRSGARPYAVYGVNLQETDLAPGAAPAEWVLNLRHVTGTQQLAHDAARRALGILLTRVNAAGAGIATTRAAAERIAAAGSPDAFIAELAGTSRVRTGDFPERRARYRRTGWPTGRWGLRRAWGATGPVDHGALPFLRLDERLALEMAVHEEEERRALEEEIGPLEAAWRDAEEIAGIADDLLTPPGAREFVARHRGETRG